jgi:hypothetical protein
VVIGVLFGLQFSIWTSQIPFNLREIFGHKSCLVVNHQSILIFFVAEDSFGVNVVLVLGGGSRTHTLLRVKLFNSSYIATFERLRMIWSIG